MKLASAYQTLLLLTTASGIIAAAVTPELDPRIVHDVSKRPRSLPKGVLRKRQDNFFQKAAQAFGMQNFGSQAGDKIEQTQQKAAAQDQNVVDSKTQKAQGVSENQKAFQFGDADLDQNNSACRIQPIGIEHSTVYNGVGNEATFLDDEVTVAVVNTDAVDDHGQHGVHFDINNNANFRVYVEVWHGHEAHGHICLDAHSFEPNAFYGVQVNADAVIQIEVSHVEGQQ